MIGGAGSRPQPVNALEGAHAWCQPPDVGMMVVSRSAIWDHYFRDRFRFVSREAVLLLNQVGVWALSEGKEGGTPGEALAWKLTDTDNPFHDTAAPPPEWTSFTDTSARHEWRGEKKKAPGGWVGPRNNTTTTSSSLVVVSIAPNTNHLLVECTLSYHFEDAYSHNTKHSNTSYQIHTRADLKWTMKLAFTSVQAGHLGFDDPVIDISEFTCRKNRDSQGPFELIFSGTTEDTRATELISRIIRERVEASNLVEHVRDDLQKQAGFVFSGSKQLKMKKPTFSPDGDLTVALTLLGNAQ